MALTASAAKLIGGNTLHSTFCINEDYTEFYIRNRLQLFTPQQKVIEGYDVIFVDEVSMMSQTLFYQLNLVCKHTTTNPDNHLKLFGGKILIFFWRFLSVTAC